MRFNSYEFALFFALVLLLCPLCRGRARHGMLLAASYVFYMSWSAPFVLLLVFSTVLDYFCGRGVARARSAMARGTWVAASLIGNLGPLAYFKYGNFFVENVAWVSGVDPSPFYLDVVIPLGISFYTFQSLSYTLDCWRRETPVCGSLLDFALYVTFFPQLIAGPILRASEFVPQLARRDPVREDEMLQGVELVLIGLFKKVVVADNLALLVDRVFGASGGYGAPAVLLAGAAFWAQIYCDFSGYSTMAQGLAALLGYRLPRNFDFPMLRHNPLLYRRTWHITMGNWFTDYVYRPLGGSRVGDVRFAFNIFVTWALLGLWHGAAWNFVLWGSYNGVVLAVYSVALRHKRWSLPAFPGKLFLAWLANASLILLSAVMFRAQSAGQAWEMLRTLARWEPGRGVEPAWWGVMALLLALHALSFWRYREDLLQRLRWPRRVALVTATCVAIACLAATGRPFIYFQF